MQTSEKQDRRRMSKVGRWIAFFLVLSVLGGIGMITLRKNVVSEKPREVKTYEVWNDAVIDTASNIAVQDGGRIKPFSTWAAFTMLKLHGSRSMKIEVSEEEVKLGPDDIMLDCLFRPELAKQLPLFRIDDSKIITGLVVHAKTQKVHHSPVIEKKFLDAIEEIKKNKSRRDRYSYNELADVVPVLLTTADQLRSTELSKAEMSLEARSTLDLADKIGLFLQLTYHMDFVRADISLKKAPPEGGHRMSYWVRIFPVLVQEIRKMMGPSSQGMPDEMRLLLGELETKMLRASENIRMVPPYSKEEEEWIPMGKRLEKVFAGQRDYSDALLADMEMLENACIALQEGEWDERQDDFVKALEIWKESVHTRISPEAVDLLNTEVTHNKMNYFYRTLIIFIFAFVFIMFGWLAPRTIGARICNWIAIVLGLGALCLMIAGITHRCVIMNRSPIGNLYDTIIFIGTVGVLVMFLVELMTRRAVALGLAIFMGMACMFLARRYEIGDARDHMDPLVAVLKSNYWLSTHVVTITIGYMGGLAAAGLSTIYIFARVLGIDEGDKSFRRAMTRIAYGMVCFTLFFSLIGTVLGGIWANDSWGRFWGWDPKENGALMIVLWCLAVLHARLAGYIKDWGVHIAGVFGANIVAFSWWHVNSLSTGLHSYGFIDGIGFIWIFYGMITTVCLTAAIAAFITKGNKSRAKKLQETSTS